MGLKWRLCGKRKQQQQKQQQQQQQQGRERTAPQKERGLWRAKEREAGGAKGWEKPEPAIQQVPNAAKSIQRNAQRTHTWIKIGN